MSRFQVRKVAVLGAGVMGAQIAAHLVNVKVPVVLFDLPAKEGPKNGIVTKAIDGLKKLKPAPLGVVEDLRYRPPEGFVAILLNDLGDPLSSDASGADEGAHVTHQRIW